MDPNDRRSDLSRPLAELHSNERHKHDSRYLRGTLTESLADPATGSITPGDTLLTKFFGIYQQDDRDLREERRRARLEPRYQFMVRVRLPGGVCTPAQWLGLDQLARHYGGGTLRLTTRQTFQFHRIRKRNLRAHLQGIRAVGLDTIAACGDDTRNVICTANPLLSAAHAEVSALARSVGAHLLPRTGAYRENFLDEKPQTAPPENEEPLYGTTYLPRKFKIALAVPPHNDIDVFAHDLGFIAIVTDGRIEGFDVCVGGGMGMTHKVPATFPRLSDVIGFCSPDEVIQIAEQTMCIQRDFGDRVDRGHARFKYTIEDRGVDWFRAELAGRRGGRTLGPARPFRFESSADRPGWTQGEDGRWHYTLCVENGRIADFPGRQLMSGLRSIAAIHEGVFALTTNQNVIIAGIAAEKRSAIEALLRSHQIENGSATALRQHAMACVAFPTCGLAMAESERYLPSLLDKLDEIVTSAGLRDQPITLRMTGCPNGCARPYLAEIALVGKAPGRYNLYLGASATGERMNTLFRENLTEPQILDELRQLLQRYAAGRTPGERFGDFAIRTAVVPAMLAGRDFQK